MVGEDYKIKGNFKNRIFLATHSTSNQYFAWKRIAVDSLSNEELKLISEEIKTVNNFHHKNIIQFSSVFVFNININIISPFYCFGSAKDCIQNYFITGFPEIIASLIIRDVLLAVQYLSSKGVIHRSIRASKILLNSKTAVLTGFRDSTSLMIDGLRIKSLHSLPVHAEKSINWMAPELLEQNLLGYCEVSDIYSVGITSCELANGIAPFADLPSTLMLTEKVRGNQPSLLDSSTFPSDEIIAQALDSGIGEAWAADQTRNTYSSRTLSDSFHKFVEEAMTRYPGARPSASQLLTQHAFFKQCKHNSLEEQFRTVLDAANIDKISIDNTTKPSDGELSREIESLSICEPSEWDF